MTQEELLKEIQDQRPSVVYVSGKTSTGKSTFAQKLGSCGYAQIELDKIVKETVVSNFEVATGDAFLAAYRGEGPTEQTDRFIEGAKGVIDEQLKFSPVVIEGAVAKADILQRIIGDR